MLRHLTINNFTLVKSLDIEFMNGMSVVTGETGAGKSIMLDALSLTLGSRADSAVIAIDADRAEINATFDVSSNEEASQWLNAQDLNDQETCILRRVIGRDGRSRGFINGVPSTLSDMSHIGNLLADIHSQHEHQSLLKNQTHRKLLDEFGSHLQAVEQVAACYQAYRDAQQRLQTIMGDGEQGSARLQLLHYQLEELVELDLTDNETAKLEAEQKHLANAEDALAACNRAIELCKQDEQANAVDMLTSAIDHLSSIDDGAIREVVELLTSAQIQIDEAMADLQSVDGSFKADPARLLDVENRLTQIYDIARKHRVAPDGLPELKGNIEREIASLENIDVEIQSLEAEMSALTERYHEAADRLTEHRKSASNTLAVEVTEKLTDLGMAGASFSIELKPKTPDVHQFGNEDIEFLISTNPNQPSRALARIASGGELSRISLAIQVVTADTSRVPTLVFDEVDVGIGGATAEVVGSLLRRLGEKAQIICVTHLAQVAAQGQHHLSVIKTQSNTEVSYLDNNERVSEVARMLGGIEVTDQSLAHAQQMLASVQG